MSFFWAYLLAIFSIPISQILIKNLIRNRLKKSYEKNKESRKILYLRSFARDGEGTEMSPSLINPLAFIVKNKGNPHELELASTLMNYGHLVAIGKPGESIPEIGFERIYFSNDSWKEEVIKLMKESVLIIYRPDPSDNVLWEFEQILNLNFKSKVIIWTGVLLDFEEPLQKARYQILSRKLLASYKITLPKYNAFKKFLSCNENDEWVQANGINDTYAYKQLINSNL